MANGHTEYSCYTSLVSVVNYFGGRLMQSLPTSRLSVGELSFSPGCPLSSNVLFKIQVRLNGGMPLDAGAF